MQNVVLPLFLFDALENNFFILIFCDLERDLFDLSSSGVYAVLSKGPSIDNVNQKRGWVDGF